MSKPWQDERVLRDLYHNQGLSMEQVADELGCAYRTVFNWMEKHSIERRPQWQEMEGPWRDKETLEKLYTEEKLSALEIAEKYDCNKKTIYNWLDRHNIPTRPSTHDIDNGWRDAELMRELYVDHDMTDVEIAGKLGTLPGTITKWRLRHGIETKYVHGQEHHLYEGGDETYYGPNWREQRRRALRRDQHRCQRCGKTRAEMDTEPDVHHIVPFEEFDHYNPANRLKNLESLCDSCHTIEDHNLGIIHK